MGLKMSSNQNSVSRKTIALPDQLWEAIAKYRFYQQIPTETETVRQLIQNGLDFGPTIKEIINFVTKRSKLYCGPFSQIYYSTNTNKVFSVLDKIAHEISIRNPAMTKEQSEDRAKEIWNDANMATGDSSAAVAFIDLVWKWLL
jgi:hypothetical protein